MKTNWKSIFMIFRVKLVKEIIFKMYQIMNYLTIVEMEWIPAETTYPMEHT